MDVLLLLIILNSYCLILTMSTYKIILDCPPGPYRPIDALPNALKNTDLSTNDFKVLSTLFGEWTFELTSEKNELYESCKKIIAKNITDMYYENNIRYGSWSQ